ncbi:lipid II flippase MurJ [Rhizobacter fulvus]
MAIVAAFAALTGAARVGQDAAIAWRYGAGPTVDAYYYLLNLVNWPVAVAISTLTLLVAPVDASLRSERPLVIRRFRSELFGAMLVVALISLPIAWWGMSLFARGVFGAPSGSASAQAALGVHALVWVVPVGLVGALFAAWLVSSGLHLLTLLEAVPPVVLIVTLLTMNDSMLFWGTSFGLTLQVIVMALALRVSDTLPSPRIGFESEAWSGFRRGASALLISQVLFTLVPLVDPFFAAGLGDSAIATISYANRLVLGMQGLAGIALQRTSLPLMANWMARDPIGARRAGLRWALVAAGAGALLGLAIAFFAEPLVSLLYERGRFTAEDRVLVAHLLRYGMFQMPSFLGGLILVATLAAAGARWSLALVAVLGLAAKLLASALLIQGHGAIGLMLATCVMYLVTATVAWIALQSRRT